MIGVVGVSIFSSVPCNALERLLQCPVTGCSSDLLSLVAMTKATHWFLRCLFILGFSPSLFPWCVAVPKGGVNGGNVTCLPQLLSFSFPPLLGGRILSKGFFYFSSPFHFSSISLSACFLGDSGVGLFVFHVVLFPSLHLFLEG